MGSLVTLDDSLSFYRADPPGEIRGGLIVIHEIWGLVDHIRDVADRYAAQGYLVLAPDLLSHIGMTPDAGREILALLNSADEETRMAAQPIMRERLAPTNAPDFADAAVATLRRAVDYLEAQSGVNGRIAVTGFCFGGSYSFALASADSRVRAAIPYYGTAPEADAMATIACPVLAFYGELDERLVSALPEVEQRAADAGVDLSVKVYPRVGHAFFNDTRPLAYGAEAAEDSWQRANEFLAANLA